MGSYTKIDENRARDILENYDLGEVVEVKALSLGISNSNYRLETTKGLYLLKISNDKNPDQLANEQKILLFLKKAGYPFSLTPIADIQGQTIYFHEKDYGAIYPFIEGIPPGPSDQTCAEIGKALAKLHLIQSDQESLRPHEEVGYGAEQIKSYVDSSSCPEDFKDIFHQVFPDELKSFIATPFKRCLIHGDLYYDNTLFSHNHLAAVLDFEQAGMGEALLDLGISITGTCLEKGELSFELMSSYLRGYREVRALEDHEINFLPTAICLGFFSISLWRIKRFLEGNLDPDRRESYRELIMKAQNFYLRQQSRPIQ